MSLTTVAEVRALVDTDLSDVDLQDVIEREEAWLAQRVGRLAGPRTVVYRNPYRHETFRLPRPASVADVMDGGNVVTADLSDDGHYIDPGLRWWVGPVAVNWTPADEHVVKRGVIELVRLASNAVDNLASETMGSYTYQKFGAAGSAGSTPSSRGAIVSSILRQARHPMTVTLR